MTSIKTDTTIAKGLDDYFYNAQIERALIQFSAIFSEIQVKTGKNKKNNNNTFITVPIVKGNKDRVVAALKADNTQNKPIRLPMLAFNLMGIDNAPDRRKGSNTSHSYTQLNRDILQDHKVVTRFMPEPYWLNIELTSITSNEYQNLQIFEQILMLFNQGDLQLQLSDDFSDWTAITELQLVNQTMNMNYPLDSAANISGGTFNLRLLAWIGSASNITNNYIKKIKYKLTLLREDDSLIDFENDLPTNSPYQMIDFDESYGDFINSKK